MGYAKLFKLIEDDKRMTSFITNLTNGYLELPYIISETIQILDDDNPFFGIISDSNKKALCIMLDQYFTDCWGLYIEDMQLNKLLSFGKIEIYKVQAENGLRYATTNEIAQGIRGLISEDIYPAGEEDYKKLCLLEWTFYGKSYYFRQAGYQLRYDDNRNVTTSFYEMIQMCALQIKELLTWVSVSSNIEKALKPIKKMKKSNGYKYASYAKDEITEDITIKQLVLNIYRVFPRNSDNTDYRRALALSIRSHKDKVKLSPMDVSWLREVYDKHALDADSQNKKSEVNLELKDMCEFLIKERFKGKINQKHFAYTIIDTLKKSNYTKCSIKQYTILEDAYKIIKGDNTDNNTTESEVKSTPIISDADIDRELFDDNDDNIFDNNNDDELFEDGDS